jgi:flagellin
VTFNNAASSADQNAIAKSIKESGLTISAESVWDATANSGSGDAVTKYSLGLNGSAADKYDVVFTDTANPNKAEIRTKDGTKVADVTITATIGDGKIKAATATTAGGSKTGTYNASSATAATNSNDIASYYDRDGNRIPANALNDYFTLNAAGTTVAAKVDAGKVYDALGNETTLKTAEVAGQKDVTGPLNLSLHVGADATDNNQINLQIASMSAKGLGVTGLKIDGTNDTNARNSIETIKTAIQKVSDQRATLGAVQNRLEHTIANLDNVVENTTSAESTIRDTDMATEMVKYSNNNILAQAGQAMLAQANQSNQGVLSLLG